MSRKNPQDDVTRPLPNAVGPEKSILSSILQQPETFIRLALNENVVEEDFYLPAHRVLYGFLLKLHADEQPIELVSLVQHLLDNGLLDRIGGPGALAELHNYAPSSCHFSTHLAIVKDKSVLREVIRRANQQIYAAYDSPDEVKELVEKVGTDAIELKTKTENRASDFKKYREQIVTSESMKEEARAYLNGDTLLGGDPFFLDGFEFACRKHESSVWLGTSFHGKSQCAQNQIAFLAAIGRKSMIASFEQDPAITMGQILRAMTAYPDLPKSDQYDPAWDYLNKMVAVYRERKRVTAAHIVQTFRQAYLNEGTDTFCIDNLLALQADRSDNTAIANTCDLLRMFVADYPVHLHLIVHPRKPSNDSKTDPNKPPTQSDIRGAAEVGDLAHNILVVWRDIKKKRRLEEMKEEGKTKFERLQFYQSTPCGYIAIEKQRLNGEMPKRNTWFDKHVNQFLIAPGTAKPMFPGSTPPWEMPH